MEQILKEPIQCSEGVNLKDLISGTADFHIDATFDKSSTTVGDPVINLYEDDDEENNSDSDDVLSGIEDSVKKQTLSSPEYKSFSDLEAIMIDCVSGGDVKLYIVEEGEGPLVPPDAVVTIHYAAYWEGEKIPFDTTLTMNFGAPKRLHLGRSCFLPGLEIGLGHVRGPAARFHLLLHPRVTWGELGILPRIRPETALFVIALYSVEDPNAGRRFNDLPAEEQSKFSVTIETVKTLNNQARQLFKKRNYLKAIKNYQQANNVMCLSRVENETQQIKLNELRIRNYINLAVCYYKLKKPKQVLKMCECLERSIDTERNCKIQFYYGRAYEMLGRIEDAMKYYRRALKLEPRNTEIGAAIVALNHRVIEEAAKEKCFWSSAFNALAEEKDCEDQIVEERNGKERITEERNCKEAITEERNGKERITEGKNCKSLITEERNCKKPVTEERNGKDPITGERNCKKPVTEEKNYKEAITEQRNGKEAITEEKNGKKPVKEERNWKGPITEERNYKEPVTEERNCKGPVTEEKNYKKPVTEERNGRKPVTEERNGKEPVTVEDKNCEVPRDVDEDLKSTIREMCNELISRTDFVKFDLSNSLTKSQLDYVKNVTSKYESLVVLVDGEGRNRTVSIVKKNF